MFLAPIIVLPLPLCIQLTLSLCKYEVYFNAYEDMLYDAASPWVQAYFLGIVCRSFLYVRQSMATVTTRRKQIWGVIRGESDDDGGTQKLYEVIRCIKITLNSASALQSTSYSCMVGKYNAAQFIKVLG